LTAYISHDLGEGSPGWSQSNI